MIGAVLTEYSEPLELRTFEDPTPADDEVVVETEACGICRSDWHAWRGDYGWLKGGKVNLNNVLGHEPVGVVVEAGEEVSHVCEGDSVLMPFNIICGHCPYCRDGDSHMCENVVEYGFRDHISGGFATHIRVPRADYNLVHMPDGVSASGMAALGCRYATSFHALAHRSSVSAGDWVAIHGCGGVGLSAVNVASALGGNVVAVDIRDDALELASSVGADVTVNASVNDDVPKEIVDVTNGGADVSVDALGRAETILNSINSLDRMGEHVQIGITTQEEAGHIEIPTDYMLHSELDMITAKGMPPQRYGELFRMIASGRLTPEKLVTNEVELAEVSDRLAAMSDYETVGVEVITEFPET